MADEVGEDQMTRERTLSEHEKAVYEWQMWVPEFGEEGQQKLKDATVMVSRLGGLGGVVAYELAAAGVGRLILAHAGNVKPSDLNRQLLMTHDWLGRPRIESAKRRLLELNPRLEILAVPENINHQNADSLVEQADVVVDCAPLFAERYAMNRAAIKHGKPLVECAMYDMEFHLFTCLPGKTACVRCLFPEQPAAWRREFPVFGAVSGAVACLGAVEAIKIIGGFGRSMEGRMLMADLRTMEFRQMELRRRDGCECHAAVDRSSS